MGFFGLFAGLLTATKVNNALDNGNQGLGEDMLDMGLSMMAGKVVKDVVDEFEDDFDDENDMDDYDSDCDDDI